MAMFDVAARRLLTCVKIREGSGPDRVAFTSGAGHAGAEPQAVPLSRSASPSRKDSVESGIPTLIKMANQIGSFFESQSLTDPVAGANAVASHLKLFWAPSMRERLLRALDAGEAGGLEPLVADALRVHRGKLLSHQGTLGPEEEETFPEGGGDAG